MLKAFGDLPAAGRPGLSHQLVPGGNEVGGWEYVELADDLVQLLPRHLPTTPGPKPSGGVPRGSPQDADASTMGSPAAQQPPDTAMQSMTNVCRRRSGSSQAAFVHSRVRSP